MSPGRSKQPADRAASHRRAAKPKLLSGGNPRIAKADGDEPVRAYLAALPGWKREVGERVDAVIARAVPDVRKAVKWNSPLYGVDGANWFLAIHAYTRFVRVTFFRGAELEPLPPGPSKTPHVRHFDVHEDDVLDEARLAKWARQAAKLPGWNPSRREA